MGIRREPIMDRFCCPLLILYPHLSWESDSTKEGCLCHMLTVVPTTHLEIKLSRVLGHKTNQC